MNLAPIVLFTYNRLDHTVKTIEALKKNSLASDSELFIYSDAPKNTESEESVAEVRSYLKTITGFKEITVREREKNYGLADSIVDGVTTIVNQYGKVIVLEDDIVTSPFFLEYMNDALELYKDEPKVMHVSGYFYPVNNSDLPETFFYNQTSCWGWGTWSRAWSHYNNDATTLLNEIKSTGRLKEFDMDGDFKFSSTLRANIEGRQKTWAIKWHASVFLKNGLCLHPRSSFTYNTGNDGSGTHAERSSDYNTITTDSQQYQLTEISLLENTVARNEAKHFLKSTKPSMIEKIIKKIWK